MFLVMPIIGSFMAMYDTRHNCPLRLHKVTSSMASPPVPSFQLVNFVTTTFMVFFQKTIFKNGQIIMQQTVEELKKDGGTELTKAQIIFAKT